MSPNLKLVVLGIDGVVPDPREGVLGESCEGVDQVSVLSLIEEVHEVLDFGDLLGRKFLDLLDEGFLQRASGSGHFFFESMRCVERGGR